MQSQVGSRLWCRRHRYHIFSHIRYVLPHGRIFATYSNGGYQIAQSLLQSVREDGLVQDFSKGSGYDSGSGDGSDLFCDHGGNRDDLFSLSDSDLRELLCDVFKYCDGTAESVL